MRLITFKVTAVLAVSWLGLGMGYGQESGKRRLTEDDYRLWSDMENGKLSPDGSSVSYSLLYPNGEDTLFVSGSGPKIVIPHGKNGQFAKDGRFVCLADGDLLIANPTNAEQKRLAGVKSYAFTEKGMTWLSKSGKLVIGSADGKLLRSLDSVSQFLVSPNGRSLAFVIENQSVIRVKVLNIASGKTASVIDGKESISKLVWNDGSTLLGFLSNATNGRKIHRYALKTGKCESLKLEDQASPKGSFSVHEYAKPFFNIDGSLIFEASEKYETQETAGPQVWNAADKWLYPFDKMFEGLHKFPRLFTWNRNGALIQIRDNDLPEAAIVPGGRFAILYNPRDYSPHFRTREQRDLYIMDLTTGEKVLFLKCQDYNETPINVSPDGKHIAYFDRSVWWVYDIVSKTRTKLRCPDNVAEPSDMAFVRDPYAFGGWSSDGKLAFLYDRFDVFESSLDGKGLKRLTTGRESQIVFRLAKVSVLSRTRNNYDVFTGNLYDVAHTVVLQAHSQDRQFNGYYFLGSKDGVKRFIWRNAKTDYLSTNGKGVYSWVEQSYTIPPRVMLLQPDGEVRIAAKSNVQQDRFYWGTVKQISYKGMKQETLYGTLYFPPEYDASKSYPMIVSVYERQSSYYHEYRSPRHSNTDGFNVTNLLAKGYVILMPDIIFEVGDPGPSATFCMLAAVDAAMEMAHVDPKRIGLIGHSFGGFETNFAVTHTNRFAAAVAGNGYADMVSGYLTMSENYMIPEIFRYEHFQLRMGRSLYADMEGYFRNSAVLQAEKVTTPLLTWVGAKDKQVPPQHSYEFYHALRRLGKKHVMLVYPDEDHVVNSLENNIDLNRRIEEWFGHYLKGEPERDWMKPR